MKNKIKVLIILISTAGALALACQSNPIRYSNEKPAPTVEKQTYKATGIVKAIDAETNKISIAHDDIPGYMSAMQMTEAVSDHRLLEPIKPGDKVEFEIERTGSKVLITKINKPGN